MDSDSIKRDAVPILKKHGVTKAGLFGSVVRGEAKKGSDIDILVKVGKETSLFDLVGMELELGKKLGKKVDLVEYCSIHPLLKKIILGEEVRLFETR